ncbi:MAG: SPOR domain-containing protein [Xanthomonadales bacterium]|nr:SPOR domain-containing protein [Xanthomonadales bacterium]
MDTGLKQRLIGAAVLVALAVIFLPMLVKGPAPDSGVSDVSIKMPDGPEGELETRELPLVMPGEVPKGGAVGMDTTPVDRPSAATAPPTTAAADPATTGSDESVSSDPAATASALPATAAGGDYAVHFGAYASQKGADTVVALAKAAQLPAYSEATTINGKPAFRVRIGPYATRAEAESVRLKALEVRSDVPVKVVTLDAEPASTAAPPQQVAATETPKPVAAKPPEPKPTEIKPVETKPVAAKPPVVKPAETKPVATAKPPAPKPVAAPPAAAKVGFAVQLGAFSDAAEAGAMRERLRAAGFTAFTEAVNTDKGKLTRVRVGPALDRAAADQLKSQIKAKTGIDGIVRPHP